MKRIIKSFALGLLLLSANGSTAYAHYREAGSDAWANGDYAIALREWRPLAEQGNAIAQHNLGLIYKIGQGVTQDYKEAIKWFRLSAAQGFAPAQQNLGVMYYYGRGVLQDYVYAHMWFNIAASNGDADALKNRDLTAENMTAADISKAQDFARECVRKNYKGC
jgi:TPR repeat protein